MNNLRKNIKSCLVNNNEEYKTIKIITNNNK